MGHTSNICKPVFHVYPIPHSILLSLISWCTHMYPFMACTKISYISDRGTLTSPLPLDNGSISGDCGANTFWREVMAVFKYSARHWGRVGWVEFSFWSSPVSWCLLASLWSFILASLIHFCANSWGSNHSSVKKGVIPTSSVCNWVEWITRDDQLGGGVPSGE